MKRLLLGAALALSAAAFAHPFGTGPGPGPGSGYGNGPGPGYGAGPGPGYGRGPGAGPGYGMRHGPGFGGGLMTPAERRAHHEAMHNFTDEGQCRAYMEAHHAEMQARAQERGVTLPANAPALRCEYLRK